MKEIIHYFERGFFVCGKHQEMLRCRAELPDGGQALVEGLGDCNQSALGNRRILAAPGAADLVTQPVVRRPVAAQLG
jgi:hypothetical protein